MPFLNIDNHPSRLLHTNWIDTIRNDVPEAEQQKRLTTAQLDLLHAQKWFLAIAPKRYGGLEWSLPQIVAFEESIGWADGSMGWVFTLCSGAAWFGGFLDETFAETIFKSSRVCLAGSGATTGTAALQPDGTYCIDGYWKYASGAPDATVLTANCQVTENGQPVSENGVPQVLAFCLLREEVTLHATWQEIGLVASAGHAFSAQQLRVGPERAFRIQAAYRKVDAPLFCFPFIQLAAATIAANYAGMCIHFIESFTELVKTKRGREGGIIGEKDSVRQLIKTATMELNQIRQALYTEVDRQWQFISERPTSDLPDSLIFEYAQQLAQTCRTIVNDLFPYCGLTVMRTDTAISRIWRDFQTGSQHALFCPA